MRKQGQREQEVMRRAKLELTRLCMFEKAGFTLTPGTISSEADTAKIRKATELYMRSWVIPLINAVADGNLSEIEYRL